MTSGILFVENYIAGGADQVARTLLENLPFARLTVMVNCRNDSRILFSGTLPKHITVERYGLVTISELIAFARRCPNTLLRTLMLGVCFVIRYPLFVFSLFYFRHKISRTGATIFVANNGGYPGGYYCRSATIAATFLRGMHVFHIVHSMALPARNGTRLFEWLIDRTIDRGCRVITVCQAAAVQLKKVRWINQNAEVIYNGLTNVPMPRVVRGERFCILNVGYFDHNKNQAMLIRAVAELVRRGCDDLCVHFLGADAGTGCTDECHKLVSDLGVAKHVCFKGFVTNAEQHYLQADLFVLCSYWEGLPLAILEAMRAGKPVIATNVGGVSEQVIDGVNGFLVAPDDYLALADRIFRLLCDREMLLNFGRASRDTYEKKFSLDEMISRYSNVLGLDENSGLTCVGESY